MTDTDKIAIKEMAEIICIDKDHRGDCNKCCYYDGRSRLRCSSVRDAEKLYQAGYRKQSGWISVEERLPEDSCVVLTYTSDDGVVLGVYGRSFGFTRDSVTHWMPIHEPPKGD